MPGDDNARVGEIAKRGPGYSTAMHYRFFRQVLVALSGRAPTAVMFGVYFARDLMMIADLLDREFPALKSSMWITGVDKFEDAACDDWPDSVRGLGWQSAGLGQPPDLSMAQNLIRNFGCGARIELVKQRAESFLASLPDRSQDWIYIDTAHDYESTKHLTTMCLSKLKPRGVISGDDYADHANWGVKRAVGEVIPGHSVWEDFLWYAQLAG